MKRFFQVLFIILFISICLIPLMGMKFTKNDGSTEKRELSEFPSVKEDGSWNRAFFSEFDTWITEHIGFRTKMVEAHSEIMAKVFHQSAKDSIVLGTNDWLYYAETAKDYQHVPTLSDRNVNNIAVTLQMVQQYCEAQGSAFVFTIAPNKNTVYGEQMPYYYISLAQDGNLDLIVKELAKKGVHYADMKQALTEAGKVLYQPRDSHWTYEGSLLGYQTIMQCAGLPFDTYEGVPFVQKEAWDSDLTNMLFPGEPDNDVQVEPLYSFRYEITSHETASEALNLETEQPEGEGSVLMFRDSFANAMHVYFAEQFQTARFSRVVPYRIDYVQKDKPTLTVLEIVERNLPNLAKKAPVMEAPMVTLSQKATEVKKSASKMYAEDKLTFTHLYGVIDEALLGESYQAYIVVKNGEAISAYQTFPIFEQELMNAETLGDNGYSAYIPSEQLTGTECTLVVESDGKWYAQNISFTK